MRKLSLSILAASVALLPSGAFAQAGPPPGPPAGHGWHGGGAGGGGSWHGGGGAVGGGGSWHGGMMGGRHFRHMQRGFIVPQFWWGPQFQVNNWQMYGFGDPGPDGRWIRYYDDAYLIGRDGRIRDTREGLDWDRYGEEWDMADGIPAYRGSRDYRPGDEDYAYAEGQEGRDGHDGHMREMREMHMRHGGPMPGPGYAYGGGGGYTQVYGGGYGYAAYAYPIVIETVTTTGAAQAYSEEVVEEYVQVRRAHHRARPRCRCYTPPRPPVHRAPPPRPRPPAGERG